MQRCVLPPLCAVSYCRVLGAAECEHLILTLYTRTSAISRSLFWNPTQNLLPLPALRCAQPLPQLLMTWTDADVSKTEIFWTLLPSFPRQLPPLRQPPSSLIGVRATGTATANSDLCAKHREGEGAAAGARLRWHSCRRYSR